jgi:hypothetical protein
MYTCRTTVTLPSSNQQRALSELRDQLHRKTVALDPLDLPDWSTLSMSGATEAWGPRGEINFEYTGTVQVRTLAERHARVT